MKPLLSFVQTSKPVTRFEEEDWVCVWRRNGKSKWRVFGAIERIGFGVIEISTAKGFVFVVEFDDIIWARRDEDTKKGAQP